MLLQLENCGEFLCLDSKTSKEKWGKRIQTEKEDQTPDTMSPVIIKNFL